MTTEGQGNRIVSLLGRGAIVIAYAASAQGAAQLHSCLCKAQLSTFLGSAALCDRTLQHENLQALMRAMDLAPEHERIVEELQKAKEGVPMEQLHQASQLVPALLPQRICNSTLLTHLPWCIVRTDGVSVSLSQSMLAVMQKTCLLN